MERGREWKGRGYGKGAGMGNGREWTGCGNGKGAGMERARGANRGRHTMNLARGYASRELPAALWSQRVGAQAAGWTHTALLCGHPTPEIAMHCVVHTHRDIVGPDKETELLVALEVHDTLHGAVVLAERFGELDADALTVLKLRLALEADDLRARGVE